MKKSPTRPLSSSIFDSRCMMYHRPPHPGHDRARAAAQMRSSDSINASYDFKTKKLPRLLRFSADSDRWAQRSAGTGGQRPWRSCDRRDSLHRLLSPENKTAVLLRAGKVALALALARSRALLLARALARSRARSLSLSECGGEPHL
jgi:hypothetical protein